MRKRAKSPEYVESRARIAGAWAAIFTFIAGGGALTGRLPLALVVTAGFLGLAGLVAAFLFTFEAHAGRVEKQEAEQQEAIVKALRVSVCTVAEMRIQDVGVDAVDPRVLERALRSEGDQLVYVDRDVDARLRRHLACARDGSGPALVCLYGPSKAGKSRSMLEAVKAELAEAAIVTPDTTRENLQTVLDGDVLQDAADRHGGMVVLWLDDLEGFVRVGNTGLSAGDVSRLKSEWPGLVIAATAGGRGFESQTDDERTKFADPLRQLLDRAAREHLLAGLMSAEERRALGEVVPPELAAEMRTGLGAVAVSGRELVDILVSERHPHFNDGRRCPEGAALTWAAVAVFRFGVTEPIPTAFLRELFACYATSVTEEAFQAALQWAGAPLYGHVALLRAYGDAHAPYDYLVQHAPLRKDDSAECAWRKVLRATTADNAVLLGLVASGHGRNDDASQAFRHADERGNPDGTYLLGLLLEDRGDLGEAEKAWRRLDDRGSGEAAARLGRIQRWRGEFDAAEASCLRAEERGDVEAAVELGRVFQARGDMEGAEEAWRRADEHGSATGAHNLGVWLHERGNLEGATAAWRRADERGHALSAYNLGLQLEESGDLVEAEAAYRRADERGSAEAALNLGNLLAGHDDWEGAEAAWQRSDERGSAGGAFGIGVRLRQRGDLQGAEKAFRRADERGSPDGAHAIGVLRRERGDLRGAESAFRRADELGSAVGAVSLGHLIEKTGNLQEAEAAYRRAADRGNPEGIFNLGVLLHKRGDLDEAELAYRHASEHGSRWAMFNLGVLLRERGNDRDAEEAFRQASESTEPDVAARARDALTELTG